MKALTQLGVETTFVSPPTTYISNQRKREPFDWVSYQQSKQLLKNTAEVEIEVSAMVEQEQELIDRLFVF